MLEMIGVESPPNAARLILMTIRQLEIEALLKPKGIMTFGNEAITHVSSPRYLSVLKGFCYDCCRAYVDD